MTFYQALQMDPSILKRKSSQCSAFREKVFYWTAMTVRSVLIVAFAVLFISALSAVFGQENTPFAVALFCILLGIRFVSFEYCIRDSLATLAGTFGILLLVPVAVTEMSPLMAVLFHFGGFLLLLSITTQRPELGNGGLYSFAYVYLSGNPVYGASLGKRAMLALLGYMICAAILYAKHRHMHADLRFHQVIRGFSLHNAVHLWQLRMAAGVSLILTAGYFFGVERFMWMGFACASLLSEYPYSGNATPRFRQRIAGVLAGSAAFFVLYQILPETFYPFLGMSGGLCLGFCTDYRYKTAFNCFGALTLATGIYGIQGAVILRIADTIAGVAFGWIFAFLFHKWIGTRFVPEKQEVCKHSI